MSLKIILPVLFTLSAVASAQHVEGFVYDDEAPLKGAEILNRTQQILTYTNGKGAFAIPAKPYDTLLISSYFHSKQIRIIYQNYFENKVVIALRKITNILEEVAVKTQTDKVFDSVVFNTDIKIQLINDIKNRPYLYGEQPKSNLDLAAIGKRIASLFKKRAQKPIIEHIESKDLVELFKKDIFFNQRLQLSELKINTVLQYLFFKFCTTKKINIRLLTEHRHIELLDHLICTAAAFNTIISNYKKP